MSTKIEHVFFENHFSKFRTFCKENHLQLDGLEEKHFSSYLKRPGVGVTKYQHAKYRYEQYLKNPSFFLDPQHLPMNLMEPDMLRDSVMIDISLLLKKAQANICEKAGMKKIGDLPNLALLSDYQIGVLQKILRFYARPIALIMEDLTQTVIEQPGFLILKKRVLEEARTLEIARQNHVSRQHIHMQMQTTMTTMEKVQEQLILMLTAQDDFCGDTLSIKTISSFLNEDWINIWIKNNPQFSNSFTYNSTLHCFSRK